MDMTLVSFYLVTSWTLICFCNHLSWKLFIDEGKYLLLFETDSCPGCLEIQLSVRSRCPKASGTSAEIKEGRKRPQQAHSGVWLYKCHSALEFFCTWEFLRANVTPALTEASVLPLRVGQYHQCSLLPDWGTAQLGIASYEQNSYFPFTKLFCHWVYAVPSQVSRAIRTTDHK